MFERRREARAEADQTEAAALERSVATVPPWSGAGLTATAVTTSVRRGLRGRQALAAVELSDATVRVVLRHDEVVDLVAERQGIVDSVGDDPLVHLAWARAAAPSSVVAEVTGHLPDRSIAFLVTPIHGAPEVVLAGDDLASFTAWVQSFGC